MAKEIQDEEEITRIPLTFHFERQRAKTLLLRGVDPSCLAGRKNEFDVVESVVKIMPQVKNIKTNGISIRKQLRALTTILKHPLRGNPVIAISSFPSDLRAKLVAMNIMNRAIDVQNETHKRAIRARAMPLWHMVTGGYKDALRDGDISERPCMLLITNANMDSTAAKIEKVRDLLEVFNDIPRVIVTGGEDPLTFCANRLRYPVDVGLYFGSDSKVSILDI